MKNKILIILFTAIYSAAQCQLKSHANLNEHELLAQEYLVKSKYQKIAGAILIGLGVLFAVVAKNASKEAELDNLFPGTTELLIAAGLTTVGIMELVSGAKSKNKATLIIKKQNTGRTIMPSSQWNIGIAIRFKQ